MRKASKPGVFFEKLIFSWGFLLSVPTRAGRVVKGIGKPGEYVQRLSKESRDMLKKLKSEDLQNVSNHFATLFNNDRT